MPFGYYPGSGEGPIDLVLHSLPIGNNNECPVARHLPQHLLGEEDHRDGLAAPLSMPEHTESAFTTLNLPEGIHGITYPEILMVLGHDLDYPTTDFHKKEEVLHNIHKSGWLASSTEDRFKGDHPFFPLAVDLLPVIKVAPLRCNTTNLSLASIR